jgi:acylphosphatase
MERPLRTLNFRVTGRVQHVWFRGWTIETARGLGLTGWVRNLPDGSVAGQAQGPAEALARLRELLREGPPSAIVGGLAAELCDIPERFADFHVRR